MSIHILSFPPEILESIFIFCSPYTLCRLESVCKLFCAIIRTNDPLWSHLIDTDQTQKKELFRKIFTHLQTEQNFFGLRAIDSGLDSYGYSDAIQQLHEKTKECFLHIYPYPLDTLEASDTRFLLQVIREHGITSHLIEGVLKHYQENLPNTSVSIAFATHLLNHFPTLLFEVLAKHPDHISQLI